MNKHSIIFVVKYVYNSFLIFSGFYGFGKWEGLYGLMFLAVGILGIYMFSIFLLKEITKAVGCKHLPDELVSGDSL